MQVIKFSLFIFLALIAQSSKSDFFSGSIWKKKMSNGHVQQIVIIGDEHSTGNKQQVEDLAKGLPNHSLVLVEDLSALYGLQITSPFSSNLLQLQKYLQEAKSTISVLNLDFRKSKFAETVIHNGRHVARVNRNGTWNINFCDASRDLKEYRDTIKQWKKETHDLNDGSVLNEAYRRFRNKMQHNTDNLIDLQKRLDCACNNKDIHVTTQYNASNTIEESIASELNIRILHQIHINQNKECIVVVAGYHHTDAIEPVLLKLGYRCTTQERNGTYWYGRVTKPIDIKQLLAHLDRNKEKETTKQVMLSALPLTVAPALKYAPSFAKTSYGRPSASWNYAWKNQKPFSATAMRSATSEWMRRPFVMSQFRWPRIPFNSMPRSLKLGGLAATGLGLALLNRK